MERSFRDFSAAYVIYKSIPDGDFIKTLDVAKIHGIPDYLAKRAVALMMRNSVVKIQRDPVNKRTPVGITKAPGSSIFSVFKCFGISETEEEVIPKVTEALNWRRYAVSRKRPKGPPENHYLDDLPDNSRIAKCGHRSRTRYFKCENCMKVLPEDDGEDYNVHI